MCRLDVSSMYCLNTTRSIVRSLALFGLLLLLPLASTALAAADPSEQMRPFLNKVTALLADPTLKQASRQEQCQRMIVVVRERFDFQEMSKRVLGKQWRQLSAQEQAHFEDLFTQLLQYAYVGKIDEYSDQKIELTQQRIKGDRAEVQTLLVDNQRTIPISYILLLKGDEWMAYDIVVEGVSLVRNYMEQFQQILSKEGYPALLEQIKGKISQLEQQYKQG